MITENQLRSLVKIHCPEWMTDQWDRVRDDAIVLAKAIYEEAKKEHRENHKLMTMLPKNATTGQSEVDALTIECPQCKRHNIPSAIVTNLCTSCANKKRGVW